LAVARGAAHKKANAHALLDVKDIFINATIWRRFLSASITVEVVDCDTIKRLDQAVAHTSKRRIVDISMIRNHPEATDRCFRED
jgi:hypothetical protein